LQRILFCRIGQMPFVRWAGHEIFWFLRLALAGGWARLPMLTDSISWAWHWRQQLSKGLQSRSVLAGHCIDVGTRSQTRRKQRRLSGCAFFLLERCFRESRAFCETVSSRNSET